MPEPEKWHTREAFIDRLKTCGLYPLKASGIEILQMNITRRCNLTCKHCHVQAGPNRNESMSHDTLNRCISVAAYPGISIVDITGGTPELHPEFEFLVHEMAALGKRLIVRSNLVILLEPEFQPLMAFYAANRVELVGSLPDYRAERADRQRGAGVFDKTVAAILRLNQLGYAKSDSGLLLHLVHNPAGAYLPGSQAALEAEYRRVLFQSHGIVFNNLFCLVNCPIGRYLDYLKTSGNLMDYMHALQRAFNIHTVDRVMCRNTLSVGWDGRLYDCDFNQMLNISVNSGAPDQIESFDFDRLAGREIVVRDHCYACTAGSGSSCQGELAVQ